jgi:hypothetical protein
MEGGLEAQQLTSIIVNPIGGLNRAHPTKLEKLTFVTRDSMISLYGISILPA